MGHIGEEAMGGEGMQKGGTAEKKPSCPTTTLSEASCRYSGEQNKGHNYRAIPPQLSSWQSAVQEPKVASRLGLIPTRLGLIPIDRPNWGEVMHDPFLDLTIGTTPSWSPVPSQEPVLLSLIQFCTGDMWMFKHLIWLQRTHSQHSWAAQA